MSELKKENVKKCLSVLREYIEGSSSLDNQKDSAVLALNQLQKITAGSDSANGNSNILFITCIGRPRASI